MCQHALCSLSYTPRTPCGLLLFISYRVCVLFCVCRLVDWQPTYGNVEALLVQIAAFLAHSSARVASLAAKGGSSSKDSGGAEGGGGDDDDEARRAKAQRAYEGLRAFHAKKGWSNAQAQVA